MKTKGTIITAIAVACIALSATASSLYAWAPGGGDLDSAVKTGDFTGYLTNLTAWLNQKAPATVNETAAAGLLKDPALRNALDQWQLITKTGADKLAAFAKGGADNQAFLSWLMKDTEAMDLYLEGVVPISLSAREANKYSLDTRPLEIWKTILKADPAAKEGMYLRMAIALAICPPGSINIGAGGAGPGQIDDPVTRYNYYKAAQKNKELFPSFDHLTVWEYTHVLSSGATDADLTWARNMLNTFRPDLRKDEMVVNSTSFVWRRAAPPQFYPGGYGTFKNVLAGGGKCGPRSSWSQMICHAFGVPAIGVGQPAHACVAYKAANPMTQPQPGSTWKVGFGRGWDASKLIGMSGPEFVAGIDKRSDAAKFSQVEHLRWLAAALTPADRAAKFLAVAHEINDSIKAVKTDITASLKPEEAEADPGVKAPAKAGQPTSPAAQTAKPAGPIKAAGGVIHVEAADFVATGGKISWGGQFPYVLVPD